MSSTPSFPLSPQALRAFEELARISLADATTDSVLSRIAELAKATVPGAAEASVTLVAQDRAETAACTGRLARDLDESQYGHGYGPCLESAVGREVMAIPTRARRPGGRTTPGCAWSAAR